MKNSKFKQLKGIVLTIPVFLFVSFYSSAYGQTVTQSNCFSITAAPKSSTVDQCTTNTCRTGSEDYQCDTCVIVTIKSDKCLGLNPTTFKITSAGDEICYSVCSGSSPDFNVIHGPSGGILDCSWYNPRIISYNIAGGIPDNGTATFMICHSKAAGSQTFTISLPPGTTCNGTPCTSATVTF
jgi:hypothetical protein